MNYICSFVMNNQLKSNMITSLNLEKFEFNERTDSQKKKKRKEIFAKTFIFLFNILRDFEFSN